MKFQITAPTKDQVKQVQNLFAHKSKGSNALDDLTNMVAKAKGGEELTEEEGRQVASRKHLRLTFTMDSDVKPLQK